MHGLLERIKQIYLECVEALLEKEPLTTKITYRVQTVWDILAAENNHDLINKLRRCERREPGYETILIPDDGWSKNDDTNDAIMTWLRLHDIHVYSASQEIKELSDTLKEE
jgi:hypothetical protein